MPARLTDGPTPFASHMHKYLLLCIPPADLMHSAPDKTMAAVLLHNNAYHKSKWDNYGHVVDQEGDSYSIAFEEPGDAVQFCLQVSVTSLSQHFNGLLTIHELPTCSVLPTQQALAFPLSQ